MKRIPLGLCAVCFLLLSAPAFGQGVLIVINPPHPLKPALQLALPQLAQVLGRGKGQGQNLESGG